MYIRDFPQYYVKDGERRAVYYSAEARDLKSLGWTLEVKNKEVKSKTAKRSEPEPQPESITQEASKLEAEVIIEDSPEDEKSLPDFEFMTKIELLEYALERGVDLPNNALKAELVEACKKL